MILFEGKLLGNDMQTAVLEQLWESCIATVYDRKTIAEHVIAACGKVAEKIRNGTYQQVLEPLMEQGLFSSEQLEEAIAFFDKENLQLKYQNQENIHIQLLIERKNVIFSARYRAGERSRIFRIREVLFRFLLRLQVDK